MRRLIAAAAAIFAASVVTAAAADDPVGWWKLDEGSGSTAFDSSGSGFNGTLINDPTWVAGKIGGALSFNGTTQYVDFGDNLDLIGSDLSLSIWVKPTALANASPFIDKLQANGNYRIHGEGNGTITYGIRNTAGSFEGLSSATGVLVAGTWIHIAVVHTNAPNQGTLYINGVAVGTKTYAITRGDTSSVLKSGFSDNNNSYFNGTVDDIRIYDRALTPAEVLALATPHAMSCPSGD